MGGEERDRRGIDAGRGETDRTRNGDRRGRKGKESWRVRGGGVRGGKTTPLVGDVTN